MHIRILPLSQQEKENYLKLKKCSYEQITALRCLGTCDSSEQKLVFYIRIENIGTKTLLAVNRSYIFYSNILRLGSWIEEAAENMMHNQLPIEWGEKKLFLIILKSPKTCNQSERIVYWLNVTDGKDISFKYFNLFFFINQNW